MTRLSKKLRQLDEFLVSNAVGEEAMLLSQMDGFVAGLIVCPDLIPPGEWLHLIWGGEDPVFENEKDAQRIIDLIMGHYNKVIGQLNLARYQPVYEFDNDDSALWEIWMEGFWRAMRLRSEAWSVYAQNEDEDAQQAFFVLARLAELATQADTVPMDVDEELKSLAPELIPSRVEILHRARLAQHGSYPDLAHEHHPKIGRNDPCPCGSGRKYKKCCLN